MTFAELPNHVQGPVHTETFSCVFVLFTVLKGIENNQLIIETIQKRRKTFPCVWGLNQVVDYYNGLLVIEHIPICFRLVGLY